MTVSVNGTNGLVFNDGSTQATAASGFGFKNRIINGAMVIDQRNAGAAVTSTGGNIYTVDRYMGRGVSGKLTFQQSATAPTGFIKSLLATSTSAYSITSTDINAIRQAIEGFNVADLGLGTAAASQFTLSFWARSSLTGTFGGTFRNADGTRAYPFTYAINAANTWEYKTITVTGDTSGTWVTDTGIGLEVSFGLGVGSTYSGTAGAWASGNLLSATGAQSVVGTNGATFYITGVQLEKGSTATSFDYRPYGTELQLCQRYYIKYQTTASDYLPFLGQCRGATNGAFSLPFFMRSAPSIGYNNISVNDTSVNAAVTSMSVSSYYGSVFFQAVASGGGLTTNRPVVLYTNGSAGYIDFSAEL